MTDPAGAALRIVTAGLLSATAGIHLYLWDSDGYRHIPSIGPLFLLNGVAGALLALACLGTPRRCAAAVYFLAAGFAAATMIGLVVSINFGLFGFKETAGGPLVPQALSVEAGSVASATALLLVSRRRRSSRPA